jgi:hypothetical protein
MKRATWLDLCTVSDDDLQALTQPGRQALSKLDEVLFDLWNLGENVLLAWTHERRELRVLAVRHYEIAEAIDGKAAHAEAAISATDLINYILAGPKYLPLEQFVRACRILERTPHVVEVNFEPGREIDPELISNLVRRYGVSLVKGRAVVLLDAVEFSLHSPLEQVAMLNSLAYSVNSAHQQLLSKDIHINFARTSTGDGFYIWNRSQSFEANIALYKLAMMVLADNAVAQSKARRSCVPRLRAAFHVGEHYEFYQVEALNPTTFSYIVGQVTIDLSRMIEKALPGQILVGEFEVEVGDQPRGRTTRYDTLKFVEKTAGTLDQLHGLEIAGDHIERIRCYLTGQGPGGDRYPVNRYRIQDKHGAERSVYNAKINIHRQRAEPIFLGIPNESLADFDAAGVEVLTRESS